MTAWPSGRHGGDVVTRVQAADRSQLEAAIIGAVCKGQLTPRDIDEELEQLGGGLSTVH